MQQLIWHSPILVDTSHNEKYYFIYVSSVSKLLQQKYHLKHTKLHSFYDSVYKQ